MAHYKHLLGLVVLSGLIACSAVSGNKYDGRDGEAEAISDLRAKKPLTVYYHVENGVAVGLEIPGIESCSPSQMSYSPEHEVFKMITEAAFQEGEPRTDKQLQLANSAIRFARAYNVTTFRIRRGEVQDICPYARIR